MRDKDKLDVLLDSALATYADPASRIEQRVLASLQAARGAAERRSWLARTGSWLPWAIAVPAAATLLFWIAISKVQHLPATKTQQAYQPERAQVPSIDAPATAASANSNQKGSSGAKARIGSVKLSGSTKVVPSQKIGRPGISQQAMKACPVLGLDSAAKIGAASSSCSAAQTVPAGTQVAEAVPRPKLDVFPTPQPLTSQERALVSVTTEAPVPVRKALADAQTQDNFPIHIAAIHIPPVEPLVETQR